MPSLPRESKDAKTEVEVEMEPETETEPKPKPKLKPKPADRKKTAVGCAAWPHAWPPGLVVAIHIYNEQDPTATVSIDHLRSVARDARACSVSRIIAITNTAIKSPTEKRIEAAARAAQRRFALTRARAAAGKHAAAADAAIASAGKVVDGDLAGFKWELRLENEFTFRLTSMTLTPIYRRMTLQEIASEQLVDGTKPAGWTKRSVNDECIRRYGFEVGECVWSERRNEGTRQTVIIIPKMDRH